MTSEPELEAGRKVWEEARKVSADEISAYANLRRLTAQREAFRKDSWNALARNWEQSVFYQLNLQEAAEAYAAEGLELPAPLPETVLDTIRLPFWGSGEFTTVLFVPILPDNSP